MNFRLQPRASFGMQFEFLETGDNNGIINWLATSAGTKPYENPHLTGQYVFYNFYWTMFYWRWYINYIFLYFRLTVSASSLGTGHESYLVAQDPEELWTEDVPASWFCIDLGVHRAVVPTYYTLRHGGQYPTDFPRTWDLQGTTDGKDWTVLKKHTSDKSFREAFQSCSWEINASKAYRKFRVLQTGHSSRGRNFLLLSGIELYGELYEYQDVNPPQPTQSALDAKKPSPGPKAPRIALPL